MRTPRQQNQLTGGKKYRLENTFWETKKKGGLSKQKKNQKKVPFYLYSVFRANLTEILHERRHKKLRNADCMTQETAGQIAAGHFEKSSIKKISGWFVRFF